jgi:hypothetical protein
MRQLLRFFANEDRAKQFASGSIFMNHLSYFWTKGFEEQRDFFEGIGCTISREAFAGFDPQFLEVLCLDPAFRFDAYKYCNICSFCRVDIDNKTNVIQLPSPAVNKFGSYVVIIHDEQQFLNRVNREISKHSSWRYLCGDVRYTARTDPKTQKAFSGHSIDLLTYDMFHIRELISENDMSKTRSRDCFSKTMRYAEQIEWRICLLRYPYTEEQYCLEVENLSDIVTIVKTVDLRMWLMSNYKYYMLGKVEEQFQPFYGNISRRELNRVITNIDGMVWLNTTIG